MATSYRTCNICEASCGIAVEHDGGVVTSIRGDEADPFSRGHLCPKAVALGDLHTDPDRLRAPERRVRGGGDGADGADGGFAPCDWDSALRESGARLAAIQARYGRDAVAIYVGNPIAHNYGAALYTVGLVAALGTKNRYSANSTDGLPQLVASSAMYGNQTLLPVADLERTEHLFMLGANPLVSNGSILCAPGIKRRLEALRRRGGRLVVVDPRRTETAAMADEHVPIRPGTDALLLAAMLRVLYTEKRTRLGRLAPFVDGFERLGELVEPFSPARVAGATGIAAGTIERLARELAASPRAACYLRVGVCQTRFGALAAWLGNALNVVTGNLDREGGAMFTTPAFDLVALAELLGQTGNFGKFRSRVRGLPAFGDELPVVTLADEIETEGEGQVRALVTIAGNPVLSAPNGRRLDRALGKLEFMVSIDPFRNETTRHADFILPPTSQLEQGHYGLATSTFSVRDVAKYSPPTFDKPAGGKHDWEILLELGASIARGRGPFSRLAGKAVRLALGRLGPEGVLDLALQAGPYGRFGERARELLGKEAVDAPLSLAELRRHPHGLDLGALVPRLPDRLATKDKRILLAPPALVADLPRLVRELELPRENGLVLIGRRQLRTNNSWLHNSLRMVKGSDRCTLLMHPDDAVARGLTHGERVRLSSRVGAVELPLQLAPHMMPGVVSAPHGFGHDRVGIKLRVASAHAGVSVNDVTDETFIDELTGMAALNGVPVTVESLEPAGLTPPL